MHRHVAAISSVEAARAWAYSFAILREHRKITLYFVVTALFFVFMDFRKHFNLFNGFFFSINI